MKWLGIDALVSGFALAASTVLPCAAQIAVDPSEDVDCDVATTGQTAGPWDLKRDINPAGDELWGEIAHLVVLPPPNGGKVLFLCRRIANEPFGCNFLPAEAFLWDPTEPSGVALTITLPQGQPGYGQPGEYDPFCSAHATTSNGKPVFYGGTNLKEDCMHGSEPDAAWGHRQAWVFDNALYTPLVPPYPAFYLTNPFMFERYYPTALQRGDDRITVFGHTGEPTYSPPNAYTRERATWSAGQLTWEPTSQDIKNYQKTAAGCSSQPLVYLGDYPRIHQLANGRAISVRDPGYVLDFNACPEPENERFLALSTASPQPQQESNNTVHYVDLRDLDLNGADEEWIVSIGGANVEAGCDPPPPGTPALAESGEVVYMKDPAPFMGWTPLPSLQKSRTEANTVVDLTGAMITCVGYGHKADGTLVGRKRSEIFRPSFEPDFLFGPTTASTEWLELCPLHEPHAYHSVAGLLPDGRLVIAGGNLGCGAGGPLDSGAYVVEMYSPPSLFGGPRPRIENLPQSEFIYTNPANPQTFTMEVKLQGGNAGESV